jgi:DNA-binding response OmpR family regulator
MSAVAIYEEDDLMRALLEEWVSGAGYRVCTGAPPPVQAAEGVDLVIVSIYMPKHSGAPLIRDIQAAYPGTPMIALSCQFRGGLSSAGATARSLGVAQVIAKPLTRDALLTAIDAMIGPADLHTVQTRCPP